MRFFKPRHAIATICLVFAYPTQPAGAAVLTTVPMQGTMVHINVLFRNQPTDSITVSVDPIVPTLTPLSLSNPDDSFDPAYPWALILEQRAFSRRYGVVLDGESDNLPAGYGISLRQLDSSPGLEAYRYRAVAGSPATSEFYGIFGTNGSGDTWPWNRSMFHATYAAPAGTGDYWASYEAFVVDSSGERVAEYTPGQYTLLFTSVPEPATALSLLLGLCTLGMSRRRASLAQGNN